MAKTRRRTRRTDSNGALKDAYKGSWDRECLDNARRIGIPEKMLDPAGSDHWRESGDTLGLWSELVYVLSDCLRGVDHLDNERRDNLGIVEEVYGLMFRIAEGLGIDPVAVIPWDVWYIRRELSPRASVEDRTAGEVEAAEDARASMAEVCGAVMASWGAPSGPGHDSHGHGLSVTTAGPQWVCFREDSE